MFYTDAASTAGGYKLETPLSLAGAPQTTGKECLPQTSWLSPQHWLLPCWGNRPAWEGQISVPQGTHPILACPLLLSNCSWRPPGTRNGPFPEGYGSPESLPISTRDRASGHPSSQHTRCTGASTRVHNEGTAATQKLSFNGHPASLGASKRTGKQI